MPDEQQLDLHFPKAGLNVVSAFSRQPNRPVAPDSNIYARTTPVAVNVRGFDAALRRVRGGSRPGLSKGSPAPGEQVNGVSWVVQDVDTFAWIGQSPYATIIQKLAGYYALDGDLLDSSGHGFHLVADTPPSTAYAAGILEDGLAVGQGYRKPQGGVADAGMSMSAWFYTTAGTGAGAGVGFGRGTEAGDAFRLAYRCDGVNGEVVVRDRTGADVVTSGFVLPLGEWHFAAMTYRESSGEVFLYLDGAIVPVIVPPHILAAGWSALTFGINTAGDDFTSPMDEVGVYSQRLTAAEVLRLWNSGAGVNPVSANMQLSQSGRVVQLVAVSQGVVKVANPGDTSWTATTNNTGETPPLNYTGVLYSAANNQQLFFADGINYVYYRPTTNSVELWSTSVTAGTLPVDSAGNYARLICTWRGRTCLSGLLKDPQNIFMSKLSDPFNWDYAPASATPTQAVALNLSSLGFIGDAVTALIPYTDDVLVVGCDHSIFLVRGDPMGGGQVDRVSDAIGIAWGVAWCKDPYGTLYFISNRCGIYSLVPGAQPVRISQAIEPLVQTLNMGQNLFTMAWDDQAQGFNLYITWADEPKATTHYFWEQRTGGWFQVKRANKNHNPLCCCTFDGNDPGDRRVLEGHWDGYVRSVDPDADDDDRTKIESEVVIGPVLTPSFDSMMWKEMQAVLAETMAAGSEVAYAVYVGTTAEAALDSDPVAEGVWKAGRNATDLIRFSGHAVYLKMTSTDQWAMEAVRVLVKTQGKVQRREYR